MSISNAMLWPRIHLAAHRIISASQPVLRLYPPICTSEHRLNLCREQRHRPVHWFAFAQLIRDSHLKHHPQRRHTLTHLNNLIFRVFRHRNLHFHGRRCGRLIRGLHVGPHALSSSIQSAINATPIARFASTYISSHMAGLRKNRRLINNQTQWHASLIRHVG